MATHSMFKASLGYTSLSQKIDAKRCVDGLVSVSFLVYYFEQLKDWVVDSAVLFISRI